MTRSLKALGIALVALLALSSTVVSTASALDTFTVPKAETKLTVTGGPHVLQITGTSVKSECSHVKIEAKAKAAPSSQITTESIEYTGKTPAGETENPKCESVLGDITFDSNKCGYVLTGETTSKDGSNTDARVSIECPPGNAFTITTAVGCTIHVPPQTPTEGGVTYANGVNAKGQADVTVHATITGLTYSTTGWSGAPRARVPAGWRAEKLGPKLVPDSNPLCALGGLPAEGNTLDTNATYTIEAPEGIQVTTG
jgi:hypothetical protein